MGTERAVMSERPRTAFDYALNAMEAGWPAGSAGTAGPNTPPNPPAVATPEVIAALEQSFSIGLQMSNAFYNLSQNDGIDERHRRVMRELVEAWDNLSEQRKAIRAALAASGGDAPPPCSGCGGMGPLCLTPSTCRRGADNEVLTEVCQPAGGDAPPSLGAVPILAGHPLVRVSLTDPPTAPPAPDRLERYREALEEAHAQLDAALPLIGAQINAAAAKGDARANRDAVEWTLQVSRTIAWITALLTEDRSQELRRPDPGFAARQAHDAHWQRRAFLESLAGTIAILGKRGSGKTTTANRRRRGDAPMISQRAAVPHAAPPGDETP